MQQKRLVKSTILSLVTVFILVGAVIDLSGRVYEEKEIGNVQVIERPSLDIVTGSNSPVVETGIILDSTVRVAADVTGGATQQETNGAEETDEPKEEETIKQYPIPSLSEINSESTTKQRILALMDYFVGEGFTPEAAAGIVGNIAAESSYDPTVVSYDGCYTGICQWNNTDGGKHWWDGEDGVNEWLSRNGYEWNSFEGQAKAILGCARKGYLSDERLEELKGLDSVEQAAELFCVYYECCAGGNTTTKYYKVGSYYQGLDVRTSEAKIAYQIYNNPEMTHYDGRRPYPGDVA